MTDQKLIETRNKLLGGPVRVGLYRNKKTGEIYSVDRFETHSETLEPMVGCTAPDGWYWTRPYDLFVEKFERVDA